MSRSWHVQTAVLSGIDSLLLGCTLPPRFFVRFKAEEHIKCLFLKIPEAWEDDLLQTDLFHVARHFPKGGSAATSQESTSAGNLMLVTNLKKVHHQSMF
jgi:hypothetical protein